MARRSIYCDGVVDYYYLLLLFGDVLLSRHTIIDDDGVAVLFIVEWHDPKQHNTTRGSGEEGIVYYYVWKTQMVGYFEILLLV